MPQEIRKGGGGGSPTPTPPKADREFSEAILSKPALKRTTGWCTDYDPAPKAQHEKCDGDVGKYRCPCECHKE